MKRKTLLVLVGIVMTAILVVSVSSSKIIEMYLNTSIRVLNENSGAINAIAIVALVIVTVIYVYYTHKLVKNEEKREKKREISKKKKLLNVLLAEFKSNKALLEYLKKEVKKLEPYERKVETAVKEEVKKPEVKDLEEERKISAKEFVFLNFMDDSWNAFRNQGGFEYIESSLYDEIAEYYNLLYKIGEEVKIKRYLYFDKGSIPLETLHDFYTSLIKDSGEIPEVEKRNHDLQNKISTLLKETKGEKIP